MAATYIDELASGRKVERRREGCALLRGHLLHASVEESRCGCVGAEVPEQICFMYFVECGSPRTNCVVQTAPRVPPPAFPIHDGSIAYGIRDVGAEIRPGFRQPESTVRIFFENPYRGKRTKQAIEAVSIRAP